MCCAEYVAETFVEEALASVFKNDMYLLQIVLVVPPSSTFGKRTYCSYFE